MIMMKAVVESFFQPSIVLFVCVHNAGRSQMAEAIFNASAKKRGLDLRAASAGTVGGSSINPLARDATSEIGISMDGQRPKVLTQELIDASRVVITMGCGVDAQACPARLLVSEDWGLDDPKGQSIEVVRVIRDEIVRRVELLLDEMSADKPAQ